MTAQHTPPAGPPPAAQQTRQPWSRRRRFTVGGIVAVVALALALCFGWPGWARHAIANAGTSTTAPAVAAKVGGPLLSTDKVAMDTKITNRHLCRAVARAAHAGIRNIGIMVEWRRFEPAEGKFVGYYPMLRTLKCIQQINNNRTRGPPVQAAVQLAFAPAWATSDPNQSCGDTSICAPDSGHVDAYADAAAHLNDMAHALRVPVLFWVGFQCNIHSWFTSGPTVYEQLLSATSAKLAGTGTKVETCPLAPSGTDTAAGNYSPDDFIGALIKAGLDKSMVNGVVLGPTDHDSGFQAQLISHRLPGVPISVVFHPSSVCQLAAMVSHWRENNHFTRGSIGAYFGDHRDPMAINPGKVRKALRRR